MDKQAVRLELFNWYWSIKYESLAECNRRKNKIEKTAFIHTDPEISKLYQLFAARYHIRNHDLPKAERILRDFTADSKQEKNESHFYAYFFKGICQFNRQQYKDSIATYQIAELHIGEVPEIEAAEFNYKLASSYHRTYQVVLSAKYAKKASKVFKKHDHISRVAHCENVLGLNSHDARQYRESENHYQEALNNALKANDDDAKMLIFHNLGLLYSEQNESEKAIRFLLRGKELIQPGQHYRRIQNEFLLAKNYFRIGKTEKAVQAAENGHQLAQEINNLEFYYRCKLLTTKHLNQEPLIDIYKEAIHYYVENQLWERVKEYSEELGSHLRDHGLFQEACYYFTLAIDSRNQIEEGYTDV